MILSIPKVKKMSVWDFTSSLTDSEFSVFPLPCYTNSAKQHKRRHKWTIDITKAFLYNLSSLHCRLIKGIKDKQLNEVDIVGTGECICSG